jgi:hypothetical protein
LAFVTAAGTSNQLPTSPLSTGDRVVGQDALTEGASSVGHDLETCTVGFRLQVLCQDILTLTNRGDVLVSWQFTWGSSGQPPATFDGVVIGGTGIYRGVRGDFNAVDLPDHDVRITASLSA